MRFEIKHENSEIIGTNLKKKKKNGKELCWRKNNAHNE